MLEWIKDNTELLSVIASFGTLLIWLFYAQLLYYGFRRERRPRMLINKGVSAADLDAPCLICNMSKEPVFIQGIRVDLVTSEGTYSTPATDTDEGEIDHSQRLHGQRTRQGPLEPGRCIEIPAFKALIQRAAGVAGLRLTGGVPEDQHIKLRTLTITVMSIYGPEDHPFGARRSFDLRCDDDSDIVRLTPASLDTQRLTSRQEIREIKRWLKDHV